MLVLVPLTATATRIVWGSLPGAPSSELVLAGDQVEKLFAAPDTLAQVSPRDIDSWRQSLFSGHFDIEDL